MHSQLISILLGLGEPTSHMWGTSECENFKIDNLENGDVDEYDDDEWDIKWQDWRTDDEIGIVELACLFLTWRTENEK